jgi:hypothetical protein
MSTFENKPQRINQPTNGVGNGKGLKNGLGKGKGVKNGVSKGKGVKNGVGNGKGVESVWELGERGDFRGTFPSASCCQGFR